MKKLILLSGVSALILAVAAYAAPTGDRQKMDGNADGVITKAEAMARSDALFAKMDADGNDMLNEADKQAHLKARFAEMDADTNGAISETEFMTAHAKKMEMRKEHMGAMNGGRGYKNNKQDRHLGDGGALRQADVDGDKAISKAEFTAAAQDRFAKKDTDGNGEISQTEQSVTRKGMRGARRSAVESGL